MDKSKGMQRYHQNPALTIIIKLHDSLGHEANNIVSLKESGDVSHLKKELININLISDKLLVCLKDLVKPE